MLFKLLRYAIIGVILLAIAWVGYRQFLAPSGTLIIFSGSATIVRNQAQLVSHAGMKIQTGDQLQVPNGSRIGVRLPDSSIVRIQGPADITAVSLGFSGDKMQQVKWLVKEGRLWAKPQSLPAGASFEVETPTVTAAVRGTSFGVDYSQGRSLIYVYKHKVGVRANTGGDEVGVTEGNYIELPDGDIAGELSAGPKPASAGLRDDWVKFNEKEESEPTGDDGSASSDPSFPSLLGNIFQQPATPSSDQSSNPTSTPGTSAPKTPAPPVVTKRTLSISTNMDQLTVGSRLTLRVLTTDTKGNTVEVPLSQVKWVQNPVLGQVSDNVFLATQAGQMTLQAQWDGLESNTLSLTIQSDRPFTNP